MRTVFIVVAVLMCACTSPNGNPQHDPHTGEQLATYVYPYHDARRGVTCWVYVHPARDGASISCLPDTALTQKGHQP